jgi:hypothetical protein
MLSLAKFIKKEI